jgi:hypothetical protein
MAGTTSNGLSYPESSDYVTDGAQAIEDLAVAVNNKAGLWKIIPSSVTGGTIAANGDITVGSAVSSVIVSDAFNALYANYKITFHGGVGSTAQSIAMKLGASAANYAFVLRYDDFATGTSQRNNQASAAAWSAVGESNTSNNAVNIDVLNPNAAKRTTYTGGYIGNDVAGVTNGVHKVNTAYTDFTFSVSGTMTGGVIKIYGYN